MTWLDHFYSSSVAIPLSVLVLAIIGLLSWRKKWHQVILVLTIFLYVRYLLWRGLYTLNTGDWTSFLVSWTVYTAEFYAFVQIFLFAYHAWSPLDRKSVPLRSYPTVDIFVTVVNVFYFTVKGGYQYTQTFHSGFYVGVELYFPF